MLLGNDIYKLTITNLMFCYSPFSYAQIFQQDTVSVNTGEGNMANFVPSQPREKWQRKRTSMKMKVRRARGIKHFF